MNEDRAERVNTRFTRGGKGDAIRTTQADYAAGSIWCEHGKFKDKCDKCKKRRRK